MKKRKSRKNKGPLPQLCLFDESEMAAIAEQRILPRYAIDVTNPTSVAWQLEILACLTGKGYRDQKYFLENVKPVVKTEKESSTKWVIIPFL